MTSVYMIKRGRKLVRVEEINDTYFLTLSPEYGVWNTQSKKIAKEVVSGKANGTWAKPHSTYDPSELEVLEIKF